MRRPTAETVRLRIEENVAVTRALVAQTTMVRNPAKRLDDVPRIQEAHIFICHLWSEVAERALASDQDSAEAVPIRIEGTNT
jgi:hypothetical protein